MIWIVLLIENSLDGLLVKLDPNFVLLPSYVSTQSKLTIAGKSCSSKKRGQNFVFYNDTMKIFLYPSVENYPNTRKKKEM